MPPRKQKPAAAKAKAKAAADDDADLDALLDAAIRENQAVAGSPAALRLEQEQREAREWAAAEARAAKYICGSCGAGQAKLKCSVCGTVRYCGEQCEAAHWPEHKLRCLEMKAAAAAATAKEQHDALHNPDTEAGNCWTCGAENPRNLCNRCKVTKYCGVACQTENWPIHKGRCAHLRAQASNHYQIKSDLRKVRRGARKSQEELNVDLANASKLGRVVDIERIIAAGGNVNDPNMTGYPPLNGAAQEGHARAIGVLVRHGAQVDARDEDGYTACHYASANGQLKAVAALLEHGAQIESRTNDGRCPLFLASQCNHPEIVALLLEHGAPVDLPNENGITPLTVSAVSGYTACVRLLLQAGADPLHRANSGTTPLDVANFHPEVVALLQARIAELAIARA